MKISLLEKNKRMNNFISIVRLYKEKFLFVVVGGFATFVDFIIYFWLSAYNDIIISKSVSFMIASVFSYIGNKKYTFTDKNETNYKKICLFYLIVVINFIVNVGVNSILCGLLEYKIISFVFATVAGMTVNFLGQKYIVFKKG